MDTATATRNPPIRGRIHVRGQVQGVGFRPHVYRLATELSLAGWVRNDPSGVEIEVSGSDVAVKDLLARLTREAPPLARIDTLEFEAMPGEPSGTPGFSILASRSGQATTGITPDAAVCGDCLDELFDPANRRYRYAFINCTHCGPRYTIARALPYDRPHTSMARFELCPACREEYESPIDRRFHAQPNACPVCGPRLALLDHGGVAVGGDPVAAALTRLRRGEILAVKGLGGVHLVCDARNPVSVERLRMRKAREEKPFAVMAANAASLLNHVEMNAFERKLLESTEHPIVLLRKKPGCDEQLPGVAPGLAWLGVMLPYTPVHHLLFHEAAGRSEGRDWLNAAQPLILVMTSANPGGEPIVAGNDEALRRLSGIADAFLLHNRDILVRCDDSVVRCEPAAGPGEAETARDDRPLPATARFVRRARGYTPRAIPLAGSTPSVLAVGGYFKNTICLTRADEAFVSQHIGDLDNAPTCEAFIATLHHLMRTLDIRPDCVAHDLHPDFFSSRFARQFSAEHDIPVYGVQHHHAHIAAVMAEHRLEAPVLGIALDGVGLGTDGGAWGGELLHVAGAHCARIGRLRTLPLPGGDRAAREPWRMAASALQLLGRGREIASRFPGPVARPVQEMLERGVRTPPTSSAGRWFDAAAGLLGIKPVTAFEGQAAILLEGLAERHGPVAALEGAEDLVRPDGTLDLLPVLARLAEEKDAGYGAALFHASFAEALAHWAIRAAQDRAVESVVLGGGCFLNRVLSTALRGHLRRRGFSVYEASQLPPNDGGLSLGQAWVARAAMRADAQTISAPTTVRMTSCA